MSEHISKVMEVSGHFLGGHFHEILGIPSHMTISRPGFPK